MQRQSGLAEMVEGHVGPNAHLIFQSPHMKAGSETFCVEEAGGKSSQNTQICQPSKCCDIDLFHLWSFSFFLNVVKDGLTPPLSADAVAIIVTCLGPKNWTIVVLHFTRKYYPILVIAISFKVLEGTFI